MRRVTMLGVALSLVAVACGGDTADTTSTDATSSTTSSSTTTTTIATTTTVAETTTTTEPPPSLTDESNVTLRALGPVALGMTVEEAATAAGLDLVGELDPDAGVNCYYVAADEVKGVAFMVFEDLIQRIEVEEPSPITTRSGIGVGSTTDDLLETYPDNIEEANEAVFDGEAMGFVPNDESDANYRIFFELDEEGVVTKYRVGIKPAVDFIGGCPVPTEDEDA